jgi:sporulation protein YlmC with PRC-barrel domain
MPNRMKTYLAMMAVSSMVLGTVAWAAPNMDPRMYRSSKLVGADVENPQGEDLGDIKDVVIDAPTGRVAYVVVTFGGFLGMGEKYFAIPFAALRPEPGEKPGDQERYLLNIDKERLKNAPGFDANNWPNMADRTWGKQIYQYYNVPPYWEN